MRIFAIILLLLSVTGYSQNTGRYSHLGHADSLNISLSGSAGDNQKRLKEIINFVHQNQYDEAIHQLLKIDFREDSILLVIVTGILEDLYFLKKDWTALSELYERFPHLQGVDSSVTAFAMFYKNLPPEKIVYPHEAEVISFKTSLAGSPMIEVILNGKKFTFWIDSGAGMSVISSRVAERCNIRQSSQSQFKAVAGTGMNIDIEYGLMDSISFGGITTYNHPCLVLPKEQLEAKILGIRVLKIDGIIGWNLLQEMAVTINYPESEITFTQGGMQSTEEKNIFWMGIPIIRCSAAGKPLYFGFDTGALTTGYYESLFKKFDFPDQFTRHETLWSAGGAVDIKTTVVPSFSMEVAGQNLMIEDAGSFPQIHTDFIVTDGMFGNTDLKNFVVHFDLKSGIFRLE